MSVLPSQPYSGYPLASPVRAAPLINSQTLPAASYGFPTTGLIGGSPLPVSGAPLAQSYAPAGLVGGSVLPSSGYPVSGYPSTGLVSGGAPLVSGAPLASGALVSGSPYSTGLVGGARSYAPAVGQIAAPALASQVLAAPAVATQPAVGYGQTQIVSTYSAPSMRQSIKGESVIEYVPFEKTYYEQVPQTRVEYVSVAKNYTDYYAVEKQIEYVATPRYETITEQVPQQRTQYVPQYYTEYVPQTVTEYVAVDRVEEKIDYQPVTKQLVHYPSVDRQFVAEAERSGRIRYGGASGLVGAGLPAVGVQPVGGLVGGVQPVGGLVGYGGPAVSSVGLVPSAAAAPVVGQVSGRPLAYSQVIPGGLTSGSAVSGGYNPSVRKGAGGINITANEKKK